MRLRRYDKIVDFRHMMMVAVLAIVASTMGCGAEDRGGIGGAGGRSGAAEAAIDGDGLGELPEALPDHLWDLPDVREQSVLPPANAIACTLPSQCATGFCVDGFCCDNGCANKCMACSAAKKGGGLDGICGSVAANTDPDNDCPAGECDGKNVCKNYNGMACTAASQCLSKYCVDGFCCGNICMGACQACSAAKKGGGVDGACGSIKVGTDPDNECSGSCNGAGACDSSPQPTYANGTPCTGASQCQSGYCADGVCCDSWCLGNCQACTAAKKQQGVDGVCGNIAYDQDPDDECWGGGCNGQGLCKQYNGVPCSDKVQCLSNYCVDGFCCGNICNQMCYACSEAKKGQGFDGVCGPMASGKDPDNECNPGECNGSGTCNQPQTPQANGTVCVSGGQCASGNCVDGFCCDTACTGLCQACSAAKKGSGADGTCGNIVAETDPDSECGYGGRCAGNGTCRYYNSVSCTSAAQCFSGYCVDGVCCGNVCTSTCYACTAAKKGQGSDGACGPIANTKDPDNECNPGECNGSGACNQQQVLLLNGSTCATSVQCASGHCVDGYCCDTTCTGLCQACSASKKGSGTDGTCGNIASEADPDSECGYGGRCGGNGTCRYYNSASCSSGAQCFSGYCVDGVCCGNVCTGTCYACTAAKKGQGSDGSCGPIVSSRDPDNECNPGECNGAGACNQAQLQPNGASCTLGTQCTSGFCVDSVCCNDACTGTCMACSAVKMGQGTSGTCGFIASGLDPDDECAAGVCNGSGSCLSICPAAGTPGSCGTANCPPCPPLVMIGTGTTGVRGTFLSSSSPAWTTSTYANEASTEVPAVAAVTASAQAIGLIRRTDTIVHWTRWTPEGFTAWNTVSAASTANPVYLAAANTSYEFVTGHADGGYWQGDLAAANSVWLYSHVIKWMGVGNWWLLSGSLPPVVGYTKNGPLLVYPNGSSLVVWKDTGGYATSIGISTTTTRRPELATYFSGTHARDAFLVFQDNTPVTDQLYWSARQSGTWTSSATIANAQATEQSLLALPNDDFVLAYRTPLAQVYWSRFSGLTGTWSTPQQIPGNMTALSKPSLAQGAGDAEVELLFVDATTGNGVHARLAKGATNFTTPVAIPGAIGLAGIAAATVLAPAAQSTGNVCAADANCASGHCVDGVCCDTACTATCMACSALKKGSGVNGVCGMIAAATDPEQECGNGKACDGNGSCRSGNGQACALSTECVSNHCVDGVCCNNACSGACQACSAAKKGSGNNGVCGNIANATDPDNECSPGECNGSGACNQAQTTLANGAACFFATQCASGNCVDAVCCDSTCQGSCQACTAAKKGSGVNGTCGNIVQGADPDSECSNGACSGTGACQSDNGLSCSIAAQCLSGQCVDGVCCDNACSGTCQACSAADKGSGSDGVCGIVASGTDPNNSCGLVCGAVGACVKGPMGVTCSSGADCLSGFCANGVCCNSACNGACESCDVPGLEGTCSNGCAMSCSGTLVLSQAPMSPLAVTASKGFHSADFNGDGILDLISIGDEKFVVSLGQGNGTFVPGPLQTLGPQWTYVAGTAVGDLNGDGKADVAYTANNAFIGTGIVLNQGNGTFGAPTTTWYASPGSDDHMGPIVLGDFDANGTLDVGAILHHVFSFAGTKYRKQVYFAPRYNSGNGTQFTGSNLTIEDYIEEGSSSGAVLLTGGDFNADGNFDIAVSRGAYPALSLYRSQGVGTFSQVTSLPVSSAELMTDVNGDGYVDVPGFGNDGIFHAWFNDGTGAFATDVAYSAVTGHIHSADWNGDGAKDLVFISSSTTVGVVLNQGNGTFGPRQDYASPIAFDRLVVGDWNSDGRADVAVEGASLVILLNTCMP